MLRRAGMILVLLLAAACRQEQPVDAAAPPDGEAWLHECADGRTVTAWYPANNTARLRIDDETIVMSVAISASGARYVGGGWQWWTKGRDAWLAPLAPGEDVASAGGTHCPARSAP